MGWNLVLIVRRRRRRQIAKIDLRNCQSNRGFQDVELGTARVENIGLGLGLWILEKESYLLV